MEKRELFLRPNPECRHPPLKRRIIMADTWKGPVGWLTEKLTKPKKRKIVETPIKTQSGWGNIKSIISERKRKQEEMLNETGLRNAYRKTRGD